MKKLFIIPVLFCAATSFALTTNEINAAHAQIKARYLQFLQGTPTTFDGVSGTEAKNTFLSKLNSGINNAKNFDFTVGSNVLFEAREPVPNDGSRNDLILAEKAVYYNFLQNWLPALAYGYTVNHPDNPYYMDSEIRDLYFESLQYFESRGIKPKMSFHANDWRWDRFPPTDDGTSTGTVVAANLYLFELRMGSYCQSVLMMEDHVPAQYEATFSNAVETVKFLKFLGYSSGHTYYWLPYTGMPAGYEHWVQSDALQMYPDTTFVGTLLETDVQKRHDGLLDAQQVFSDTLQPISGWADTIKPDFTGYHHRGPVGNSYTANFMPFGASGVYSLLGTDFAVDAESVSSLKETLLVNRLHSQPFAIPHGMRMRWPDDNGTLDNGDSLGAFVIYGSSLGINDSDIAKAYKRLWNTGDLTTGCAFSGGRGKIIRGLYMVDMIKQLESDTNLVAEPNPSGFWMKPYAGLALHRRDNWMAAVKGYSKYVWDFESLTAENEYGHYLSHGMLTIFKGNTASAEIDSGYNTTAGWDWYRQPGTTAVHFDLYQQQASADADWSAGSESFMGGVSMDGQNGVFGMKLNDPEINVNTVANGASTVDITINLKAHKSVFFMDDLIVLLGTDISGGDGSYDVETTLFQCYRSSTAQKMKKNGVTFNDGSETIGSHGSMTLADHTGNGYYIPDAYGMKLYQGVQNSCQNKGTTATSGDYSTVVFNHGTHPAAETYEAAILVDGEAEIATLAASPINYYQVQRLDSDVHQVLFPKEGNTTAYVFYEAGTNDAFVAEVDTPCMVVAKPNLSGWTIGFSNPELGIVPESQTIDWDYKSDNQFMASSPKQVEVRVQGLWELTAASTQNVSIARYESGDTVLQFESKDGAEVAVGLEPYGTTTSVLVFDQVAFSEDFDSYAPDAPVPTGDKWTYISYYEPSNVFVHVRTDTGNVFGEGTGNRYLGYRDAGGRTSRLFASEIMNANAARLSFDFMEPDNGLTGSLSVRMGIDNVDKNEEEIVGGVRPVSGILDPAGSYAYDSMAHADIYFNEWAVEITYIAPDGNPATLGSGKMDVWLNGVNTGDDVVRDRYLGTNALSVIKSLRFESYSAGENEVWFDNLEVSTAVPAAISDPFSAWAAEYNLVETDAEMTADPDGDGMDNLFEFAVGGVPTNGNDAPSVFPSIGNVDSAFFEYIHRRRTDSGLKYSVERTTNLVSGTWTTNGVSISGAAPTEDGFESVTNEISTSSEDEQFVRLKITEE